MVAAEAKPGPKGVATHAFSANLLIAGSSVDWSFANQAPLQIKAVVAAAAAERFALVTYRIFKLNPAFRISTIMSNLFGEFSHVAISLSANSSVSALSKSLSLLGSHPDPGIVARGLCLLAGKPRGPTTHSRSNRDFPVLGD
jgi:hypothetical protein